jgi:polysaccharide export outer membrane protein
LSAAPNQKLTTSALAPKPSAQDLQAAKKSADEVIKRALDEAYRIGPQDVIEIKVFKVAELSKTVQVSEAGTFNFPLVGDVSASGKTAQEVERDLTSQLGSKYLEKPQVSVRITEMNSRRFTVEGAVKKPGVFPVSGSTTLLQAIAISGGLTKTGSSTVVLFRTEDGKRKAAKFDLDEIRSGSKDPKLRAGDFIIVKESAGQQALQHVLKVLPLLSVFTLI